MYEKLITESDNKRSSNVDSMTPLEIVEAIHAEDRCVTDAVETELGAIASAVELIAQQMRAGGRLIYVGAGTSGRLGVLDASECPPTFNADPGQVIGLIAGGLEALVRSIEGAEDIPAQAVLDLKDIRLCDRDVVVGIATSGRTPYVLGALKHARDVGCRRIGLACNGESEMRRYAEIMIEPIVGPEIISGSTRMKAGTATKMILNMLSTAAMVQLGKTYGNLMVDLRATNSKLTDRAKRILMKITGVDTAAADELLSLCSGELKTAIVVQVRNVDSKTARELLNSTQGRLRPLIQPNA